jgi:hypothetical protein
MLINRIIYSMALMIITAGCFARDLTKINPPYPRIANCYGAGLSWISWDKGSTYWPKVDLFIGGGYDLHYDWDNPRWNKSLAEMQENVKQIEKINPNALFLAYVDVVEGPDNPAIPKNWWDLNKNGERWSGWPGMYRINTGLNDVLQYNLDKVRTDVFGRNFIDGVFYDCWSPDKWLVPQTAKLRDGKAIVMLNAWNFPREGFDSLNGVLAEDEINRVIEGKVDYEDFIKRYLAWSARSRKPVVTTIVCHPETINDDPWRWSKLKQEERNAEQEKGKGDVQTMRFGLTTTLLGDGYFAYDSGTMGRGNWWWYKEYDAPLGYPKGPAHKNADGLWQREFLGGTVVVNGTNYDAVIHLPKMCKDVSTGRVSNKFTIPMFDGRIFIPTKEHPTKIPDMAPRITAKLPKSLRAVMLPGNIVIVQTHPGLELRFEPNGSIRQILWRGHTLITGGFPIIAAPPFKLFSVEPAKDEPQLLGNKSKTSSEASLKYLGSFVEGTQRADYIETCKITSDASFSLHFDFTALTNLDIRMCRQYFGFPVKLYAGRTAKCNINTIVLPTKMMQNEILPPSMKQTFETANAVITIESSIPLSLIDDRNNGVDDYLLAGYPVNGKLEQGMKWSVDVSVKVHAK